MGHQEILFTSWAKEVVNQRSLLFPTAIVITIVIVIIGSLQQLHYLIEFGCLSQSAAPVAASAENRNRVVIKALELGGTFQTKA